MRTAIVLAGLVLSSFRAASADPVQIYSSFGNTGNPYTDVFGYGLPPQRTIAAQFIPVESAFLQTAEVVLTHDPPPAGNTDFSVILASNAGNQPGGPLATWSVNLIATPLSTAGTLPAPTELQSTGSLFLTVGTPYWLMVSTPADFVPSAVLHWNLSNNELQGPVLLSDGGSPFSMVHPPLPPAYRLIGTLEPTPEPATLSLVGIALLGIVRMKWKSQRLSHDARRETRVRTTGQNCSAPASRSDFSAGSRIG